MDAYVKIEDLKDGGAYSGLISEVDIINVSDTSLQNLLISGKEAIDTYCGKRFTENIPNIVKIVNVQLVSAFIVDFTKKGESVKEYSYTNNLGAFSSILSMLDILDIDGETIATRKKSVRARII